MSERLASGDALPCGSSETEWTRCELWLLVEPYCVPTTHFPFVNWFSKIHPFSNDFEINDYRFIRG